MRNTDKTENNVRATWCSVFKKRRKSLQSQLRKTSRGKKHNGTPQSSSKRTSNSHRVAFLSLLTRDYLFLFLCHCACLSHRGIGVSRSLLPVSLCEHQSTGQARTPTDRGPHSMRSPCSHAHCGRATAACVSSPKRLGSLYWLAHAAGHGFLRTCCSACLTLRRAQDCV